MCTATKLRKPPRPLGETGTQCKRTRLEDQGSLGTAVERKTAASTGLYGNCGSIGPIGEQRLQPQYERAAVRRVLRTRAQIREPGRSFRELSSRYRVAGQARFSRKPRKERWAARTRAGSAGRAPQDWPPPSNDSVRKPRAPGESVHKLGTNRRRQVVAKAHPASRRFTKLVAPTAPPRPVAISTKPGRLA